jgi:hypothetical protein
MWGGLEGQDGEDIKEQMAAVHSQVWLFLKEIETNLQLCSFANFFKPKLYVTQLDWALFCLRLFTLFSFVLHFGKKLTRQKLLKREFISLIYWKIWTEHPVFSLFLYVGLLTRKNVPLFFMLFHKKLISF